MHIYAEILFFYNHYSQSRAHLQKSRKQYLKLVLIRHHSLRQLLEPAVHKGCQSQDARLQVDHATAADGGRGGNSEVLHLKHHRHHLQEEEERGRGRGRKCI